MGCCFNTLKRKSAIKPSTSFWDKHQEAIHPSQQFTSSIENIEYIYTFIKTLERNKVNSSSFKKQISQKCNEYIQKFVEFLFSYFRGLQLKGSNIFFCQFGTIKQAVRKNDPGGRLYAVKIMSRWRFQKHKRREIQNLSKLDHPNICKFFETFIDKNNVYLVMEYCSGGSLNKHPIQDRGEVYIARLIYNLATAIMHMHSMGIMHRDLNLKNILFTDNLRENFKIINFQNSTNIKESESQKKSTFSRTLTKRVGQQEFTGIDFSHFSITYSFQLLAPEVLLSSNYGEKCDVWQHIKLFCFIRIKPFQISISILLLSQFIYTIKHYFTKFQHCKQNYLLRTNFSGNRQKYKRIQNINKSKCNQTDI